MTINLKELEVGLATMQPRQRMYELIKAEMKRRGHRKNKAGGTPMKPGYDPRRKGL